MREHNTAAKGIYTCEVVEMTCLNITICVLFCFFRFDNDVPGMEGLGGETEFYVLSGTFQV